MAPAASALDSGTEVKAGSDEALPRSRLFPWFSAAGTGGVLPRASSLEHIRRSHVDAIVTALAGEFYVDADMIREAIDRRASFNVVHLATMFKADVFLLKGDSWSREEMSRARAEQFDILEGKVTIRFASPEDTLLHKIVWYKLGNQISDRQWAISSEFSRSRVTRWIKNTSTAGRRCSVYGTCFFVRERSVEGDRHGWPSRGTTSGLLCGNASQGQLASLQIPLQ